MVRKSLVVVILLVFLTSSLHASVRDAAPRDPRSGGNSIVKKVIRVIKTVTNGDGISIPKP